VLHLSCVARCDLRGDREDGQMTAAAAATRSIRWKAATSPSRSEVWRTPDALYRALDQEFDFTVDAAADEGNARCDLFIAQESDALAVSWAGERIFVNPPYGRALGRWVHKAMLEAQECGALVVMVLPARTGNIWFHRYCLPHAEIRFIRGRLSFTVAERAGRMRAPFDSMVVVFRPYRIGEGHIKAQGTFPGFNRG
jgi:phage N-6-adenine-methyltransferase